MNGMNAKAVKGMGAMMADSSVGTRATTMKKPNLRRRKPVKKIKGGKGRMGYGMTSY